MIPTLAFSVAGTEDESRRGGRNVSPPAQDEAESRKPRGVPPPSLSALAQTSLGLIRASLARNARRLPPALPKPDVDVSMLVMPGINPNRSRKGKSGELARKRGKP